MCVCGRTCLDHYGHFRLVIFVFKPFIMSSLSNFVCVCVCVVFLFMNVNCLLMFSRYHSLVKSLKILIRRARHCHHLRLLEKHCFITSPNPNAIKNSGCIFEVSILF